MLIEAFPVCVYLETQTPLGLDASMVHATQRYLAKRRWRLWWPTSVSRLLDDWRGEIAH